MPDPGDPTPVPARPAARQTFRKPQRLTHAREFRAVFDGRMRKTGGPLAVFVVANGLPRHRLGLSIGRVVGNAVARNRLKRAIREWFRTAGAFLPLDDGSGLDVVVSARPHDPLEFERYKAQLSDLVAAAARDLRRRRERADAPPTPPAEAP